MCVCVCVRIFLIWYLINHNANKIATHIPIGCWVLKLSAVHTHPWSIPRQVVYSYTPTMFSHGPTQKCVCGSNQ